MASLVPAPWEPLPGVPLDVPSPEPIKAPAPPKPSLAPPEPEAPAPLPPASDSWRPKRRIQFGNVSTGKSVKAIRTRYNGYIFRSKLEACWAIFFDAAGIRYVYEQEGYEQDWSKQKYLPDFYLPDLDFHVEVKPERPGYEKEVLRTKDFIVWGGPIKRLLILSDIPPKTDDGGMWHFPCYVYDASYSSHEGHEVTAQWFFFWDFDECGVCGNVSNTPYMPPPINEWDLERKEFAIGPMSDKKIATRDGGFQWPDTDESNYINNRLTFKALEIAREVQFDHGQTPTRDEVQRRVFDEIGD